MASIDTITEKALTVRVKSTGEVLAEKVDGAQALTAANKFIKSIDPVEVVQIMYGKKLMAVVKWVRSVQ
jgi:hypothetical protein